MSLNHPWYRGLGIGPPVVPNLRFGVLGWVPGGSSHTEPEEV